MAGATALQRKMDISQKEAIEIGFWETSPIERPGSGSLENLLMKSAEARVLVEKLPTFAPLFARASSILELGGGQGWASCIVKRTYPTAQVTLTDISPAAIASVDVWEKAFGARIDDARACRSYDTPFADGSFDLIFAYSAAHHFVRHRRTLLEIRRLLRRGGVGIYLNEPGCLAYLHRLAKYRVNRKRPEVPEDVLRYREIEELARRAGLDATTTFTPTLTNRGPLESVYYTVLAAIPRLQHVLPCTVDIIMRRKD
jgi:SAM-dependent methyltransferase